LGLAEGKTAVLKISLSKPPVGSVVQLVNEHHL